MTNTEIVERLEAIKEDIGSFSDSTIIAFIDELIDDIY